MPTLEAELARLDPRRKLLLANLHLFAEPSAGRNLTLFGCRPPRRSCVPYSQGGLCLTRSAVAAMHSDADEFVATAGYADDVSLGWWAVRHDVTMLDSPRWVTQYTRWSHGGRGKVSMREGGYDTAASCASADPQGLANFSVVHTSCMNTSAVAAACGAFWSHRLRGCRTRNVHESLVLDEACHLTMAQMWHAYLGSVGARERCDAVRYVRTQPKQPTPHAGGRREGA